MSSIFSYATEANYDEFFDSKNTRSKSSKDVTHKVWWGNNTSNSKIKTNYYCLNEQDNINLILTYLQSISRKELNIGIYTKFGYTKPLTIQITILYDNKQTESYETYDFTKKVIYEVCEILNEKYILSEDFNEHVCVYLFNKENEKNGKCNIRLVFPYFWCTEKEITQIIIPSLIKRIDTSNAYSLLSQSPKNKISMFSTIRDYMPFFMTSEEGVLYNDYVVFEKDNEIDINDVFILENCIDSLLSENIENDLQKVALLTSVYYWRKPSKIKKETSNSPGLNISANSCSTNNDEESTDLNDYFNEIYKFISSDRKCYQYFKEDMASILKNVFLKEDESYDKWKSLFPNCDLIPTKEDWYKYTNEKLTINTLCYYASVDSKEHYNTWYHRNFCLRALRKAYDEPYDANIAKAFKTIYPFQYVCTSHKQSTWYYFNNQTNGLWVEMDNDVDISNKISNDFHKFFEIFKKDEDIFQDEKKPQKRQKTKYEVISSILLSSGSKKSVINELKTIYHNSKFVELLDSEPHLTATNNIMIDARHNEVIIRDGRPEDYVGSSTGIPYHPNPSGYSELKLYLKQLFVDKGIRRYMKYMISSLLYSGNKDKIFPIFTGEGNNSKSILVSIIEKALGRYAGKVPTSLITGKRTQSSAATPELRQLLKSRIAFAQEPSRDEILNVGLIKEITGNDSLYYRTLFKEGEISKVNAILVLVCNRIPKIPDNQEAIWERVRVVPFKSKWVLNAPETMEEQFKNRIFKRDKYFEMKKSKMAISLLSMMVRKYKKYKEKGLEEPIEMYNATKHLREKTNIYQLFLNERIDKISSDDNDEYMKNFITIQEFHQSFSSWYKMEYKGNKAPTRVTFTEEVEALLQSKPDGNKFYGLKWKSNIPDITGVDFSMVV